jgi:hypothetical protein
MNVLAPLRRRWRFLALLAMISAGLAVGVSAAAAWDVQVTAHPKVDRSWNWAIHKSSNVSDVTLAKNESVQVTYSVTVSTTGYTDSNPRLDGDITVGSDPSATLTGVDGVLYFDPFWNPTPFSVVCSPSLPFVLVGPVTCPYELPIADTSKAGFVAGYTHGCVNGDCTAQVFSTSPTVDWSNPTVDNSVDECVSVNDTYAGNLGSVCAGSAPKTFTYSRTIGGYTTCGDYQIPNTATFTTDDTGTTGSSSAQIVAHVPCSSGCTLTIGYWKTHAGFGPQADMVTPLLPVRLGTSGGAKSINVTTAALAVHLLSFNGSNNVFAPSNGINKLYAQLLGAKLSAAAGASLSSVASVITSADAFLATHNSADWSGLTAAQHATVNGWASILDSYNNGRVGPAHCTQ